MQQSFTHTQINDGPIDKVFPLLCPVREKDWIDGWIYHMIHSESGLIEKDCVFTTPHHGESDTVWYVTQHDPDDYLIEFVRVTPGDTAVRINIQLEPISNAQTRAIITYRYTALNGLAAAGFDEAFRKTMEVWEKSINYYLKTSEILLVRKTPGGPSEKPHSDL